MYGTPLNGQIDNVYIEIPAEHIQESPKLLCNLYLMIGIPAGTLIILFVIFFNHII